MRTFRNLRVAIFALALLGGLGLVLADEKLEITLKEYRHKKFESVKKEAYQRALERARKTRVGMRTDQFFDVMAMYIVRDKDGKGIDGFVDGYLQAESAKTSEKTRPASVCIFGWYEDVSKREDPVPRFTVKFQDRVLIGYTFHVAEDDWRGTAAAGGTQ